MLHINDLTYRIAGRILFDKATVAIPAGHKVGLVGRNGSGKTTLFNLIGDELNLDDGHIRMNGRARIGRVAQDAPDGPESLLETVLAADTERSALLSEAETATAEVVELDGAREAALSASATLLGLPASTTLTSLVDHAPDSHLAVLRRLLTDLAHLSRAIAVLRDSTRGLAEEGRRGVLDMLDFTEPAAGTLPQFDLSDESAPRIFVGDI